MNHILQEKLQFIKSVEFLINCFELTTQHVVPIGAVYDGRSL